MVLIVAIWIRDNVPRRVDIVWLKEGGGFIKSKHPPAGRFNAGEKMVFWLALAAGIAVIASGFLLMFPFYVTDIFGMQIAQGDSRHHRLVVHRPDPCPHLHRHGRHGRRVRGHGAGHRRPQLGEGAPQPLARTDGRAPDASRKATHPRRRRSESEQHCVARPTGPFSRTMSAPAGRRPAGSEQTARF